MVGHMSVLDVEATCLGISKETFNPPSLPIEAERIHGRRDISDHQNQFITFDPKFSSWGKTELCQVLDVEPITLSGKFNNC